MTRTNLINLINESPRTRIPAKGPRVEAALA
jgi:hypothetical protein